LWSKGSSIGGVPDAGPAIAERRSAVSNEIKVAMTPDEFRQYLADYAARLREIFAEVIRQRDEYAYSSQEDFIAREGMEFAQEPLSGRDLDAIRPVVKRVAALRPRTKECFANAYRFAEIGQIMGLPVEYAEGFGLSVIPALHAWVAYKGRALDVTWRELVDERYSVRALMDRIEANIREKVYLGVPVPMRYVQNLAQASGFYPSVLDDWQNGWPVLKAGLAPLLASG
jgi:hypothetical protein